MSIKINHRMKILIFKVTCYFKKLHKEKKKKKKWSEIPPPHKSIREISTTHSNIMGVLLPT